MLSRQPVLLHHFNLGLGDSYNTARFTGDYSFDEISCDIFCFIYCIGAP